MIKKKTKTINIKSYNMSSESFCILPFVHLYAQPDGEIKPCCIAGSYDKPLKYKGNTIEGIWNSEQMKDLRKDMLCGVKNKACDVCYKKEERGEDSPRIKYNRSNNWTMPKVDENFEVPPVIQHLDIRFSNLCNLKCRMCNHTFSSSWFEDAKKMYGGVVEDSKVIKVSETIVEDLIPYLSDIRSVYFAGGEPLIMPEHFKMLKWLHENVGEYFDEELQETKKNLHLHYNTNNEVDLVNLWKDFAKVFVSISCDGIGPVGEYQRTNFDTKKFLENLDRIKTVANPSYTSGGPGKRVTGIQYNFQYTTTIYNIYHIFDFINFMIENKYVESSDSIDLYYAWSPQPTSINNIQDKEAAIKFLEEGAKQLDSPKTLKEIDQLIQFIKAPRGIDEVELKAFNKKLDELRGTSYKDIKTGIDNV